MKPNNSNQISLFSSEVYTEEIQKACPNRRRIISRPVNKPKNIDQISIIPSGVNTNEIQRTLRLVAKYIDTVTWMVLHVGPITYCEYCNGSFCICGNFTPLLTHEQLAVCDKYDNNNDGIPAMASAFMFPLATIFITKSRNSVNMKYLMVTNKDNGGYYLKEKKLEEIQEMIDWNKVHSKLERRLAYQEKRRLSISLY